MSTKHKKTVKKIPYYRKPDDLTLDEWQIALRKQFAEKQNFIIRNIGDHPVFSDFMVFNPESGNEYKVAIRDYEFGMNFCSCPDFKKTGLNTCKHIESVLKQLKDNKKNEKYWRNGYQRPYSSVSLKYGQERQVFLRIGTENESEIRELAKDYFTGDGFLKPESYQHFENFLDKALNINKNFKVYQDALDYIIEVREGNGRRKKIDTLFPESINSDYFNNLIKTDLYPYQREGVLFIARAGRALLADDMGLGKTIQAIATAELLIKEFSVSNILIICPTSLKYQWKNEIEKFTDRSIKVIEGHLDKRKFQYLDDATFKIASYGVALNDVDYLNRADFDLVILDEAQRIKNWKTKTAQNLKKLQSQYAIVLTGTPLENRLDELHSIVEFIDPYRLGALFRFLDKHQTTDMSGKVVGYHDLNKINEVLKDILLRRTKNEILKQLPERTDKNYFIEITDEQKEIHEDYAATVAKLSFKWKKQGFLSEKERKRLLLSLSCMRMVSDSTFILDQKTRFDTKIDELVLILNDIFEEDDNKVVIFSQWERMTRLVADELNKMNIQFEYLHGGVPSKKRKELINNFRDDKNKRVFLSTDAGGVGLNLQSANVIINLDLPWNPAVLEQRIGRVHRLGQQKTVYVINLISKNTIEHRILGVIGMKKSLFAGVLDGGEDRIILDNSKFNKLMETVTEITEQELQEAPFDDNYNKTEKSKKVETISSGSKPKDEKENKEKEEQKSTKKDSGQEMPEVSELITSGLGFLEKLGSAFASIQKGDVKISDFIEKDTETGQTSIKIPVKDEQVINDAINTIAGFFNKLTGK